MPGRDLYVDCEVLDLPNLTIVRHFNNNGVYGIFTDSFG